MFVTLVRKQMHVCACVCTCVRFVLAQMCSKTGVHANSTFIRAYTCWRATAYVSVHACVFVHMCARRCQRTETAFCFDIVCVSALTV